MNEKFDTDDEINEQPAFDHEVGKYIDNKIKDSIFSRDQLARMAGCKVGSINAWCRGENLCSHRSFLHIMGIISADPKRLRYFEYQKNITNLEGIIEEYENKIASFERLQNAQRKLEKTKKSQLQQADKSKKISTDEILKVRNTNSTDKEHLTLDD